MLTNAALRCLEEMIQAENEERFDDAELVCEGRACWLGTRRVHWNTLNQLVALVALRDTTSSSTVRRYMVNDVGRALDADPSLARSIRHALAHGQQFTIEDGKLQAIGSK